MNTGLQCPKCKSKELIVNEVWKGHSVQWEQHNGVIDIKSGNLESGDPYKVQCVCKKCEHRWTARGITQITDLAK